MNAEELLKQRKHQEAVVELYTAILDSITDEWPKDALYNTSDADAALLEVTNGLQGLIDKAQEKIKPLSAYEVYDPTEEEVVYEEIEEEEEEEIQGVGILIKGEPRSEHAKFFLEEKPELEMHIVNANAIEDGPQESD